MEAGTAQAGRSGPTENKGPRITREKRIVAVMIAKYCKGQAHRSGADGGLCEHCGELLAYAQLRLTRCRFGEEKSTCARCPVHCYKPVYREEIRAVMRYAGPRMIWSHPREALRHALDQFAGARRRAKR